MIYKNRLYTRVRKCHYELRYTNKFYYAVYRMKQVVKGVHWNIDYHVSFSHSSFHPDYELINSGLPF
jgi:hypothetical protein